MSIRFDINIKDSGLRSFGAAVARIESQLLHKVDEFVATPLFEEVKFECPKKTGKLRSSLRKKTSIGSKRMRMDITAEGAVNETGRRYLEFILSGQKAKSSRGRYIPGLGKRRRARSLMDSAIAGAGGSGDVLDTQRTVEYRARAKGVKTSKFNNMGWYPKREIPPNPFHERAYARWLKGSSQAGLRKLQEWIDQELRKGAT